ncbi:hypothetical protein F5148DRAFT_1368596 [Russula earlei]|uniref:Uncharacterized protein n=1 Tax=Russula earlei TaxID=71964 RepID=A0ACC0U6T1_9AGAM|nr:hypothetical protein F5148DRAFT_1368596 [Russula earlei]
MYRRITLRFSTIRDAAQSGPRLSAGPTRPMTDQAEGVYAKKGGDRNVLYICGGLEREGLGLGKTTEGSHERTVSTSDAKYQEVKAEAKAKVRATKDQNWPYLRARESALLKRPGTKLPTARLRPSPRERKVDAAKSSGWGWFNWGKSRTRAAAYDLETSGGGVSGNLEFPIRRSKQKGGQEDIKQRVDETEEFLNRILKSIEDRRRVRCVACV